jgi:hypothetical protein
LTVNGLLAAKGNVTTEAGQTMQVRGTLDLIASPPNIAAKISDGAIFEMRATGSGGNTPLRAEFDPGNRTYKFGHDTGDGATEATVNVVGNINVQDNGANVITLHGQQVGGNAGLVEAVGYVANGAGGNYRGISGNVTYARNDSTAIDTIVVSAGNTQEVRTGAIGNRTTMHSLTYDAGNTQLVEDIKAAGTEKLVKTEKATVPAGSNYELMRQTQDDTQFLRTPIYTQIDNYQMDVFTKNTDDAIPISQNFSGTAELFKLGTGEDIWTGRERNGVPFTSTPYDGTSIPFGRYRLILKQRDIAGSATCVGTAGIVNGLHISDEFLYTNIDAASGEYGGTVITDDHPVSYSFRRWSADPTTGRFPLTAGSDGHINIARQTAPNVFRFYINFSGWNTTTLTNNLSGATIAFSCQLIRLPMI